jgi:hypothetical protein
VAVRRDRPIQLDGQQSKTYSFPSGHAAITFAAATVLQQHLGYCAAIPTYAIASYVAMSRLHDNRHYASDVVFGAALGTGFLFLAFSTGANAYDHWDRERDRDHWRHDRYRYEHRHDRPVVVRERPIVVERERPVFVQPAPMYAAPMMPMYNNQGPSGLNLNFNIPLN